MWSLVKGDPDCGIQPKRCQNVSPHYSHSVSCFWDVFDATFVSKQTKYYQTAIKSMLIVAVAESCIGSNSVSFCSWFPSMAGNQETSFLPRKMFHPHDAAMALVAHPSSDGPLHDAVELYTQPCTDGKGPRQTSTHSKSSHTTIYDDFLTVRVISSAQRKHSNCIFRR